MTERGNKDQEYCDQLVAKMRLEERERQTGYREKALKIFPHVCGRCGREFEGKKLKELTIHHKDHNHENNPPDGSNWELLCIYCHEHEHTRGVQEERCLESPDRIRKPTLTHSPFGNLGEKLKTGKK